MKTTIEIEDIRNLRALAGIDDPDLWEQVHRLRLGDCVLLTFLVAVPRSASETLAVRITEMDGRAFRGRVVVGPSSPGLTARLHRGSVVTFTEDQIHSVPPPAATPAPPGTRRGPRKTPV